MPETHIKDIARSRVIGVPECEAAKVKVREQLLHGINTPGPAHAINNPNRVLARYLEAPVQELNRMTSTVEALVEEMGVPGERIHWDKQIFFGITLSPILGNWLIDDKFYWSGIDDLKRLRQRVDFYMEAVEHAKTLPQRGPGNQRAFLAEFVFFPIFYGSRHEIVNDPMSPWIHTTADWCEPSRIAKNLNYALQLDDQARDLSAVGRAVADTAGDYWEDVKDIVKRTGRGFEKLIPLAVAGVALWGGAKIIGAAKGKR